MTTTPVEPAAAPAPVAPAALPVEPVVPAEPPATPAAAEPTDPPAKPETPWEDPVAAKAEIDRLRRENGSARTNAKAQAAEDAKRELAQTIGKALGLVEDEPIDPATLTASLTTAQAEAKQAQVALAVYQAAGTVGGDPAALLDSTTFLKAVAAIDPTDSAAVTAAITSAVEANPRLGAAPAGPRTPAPNPAQGASGAGTPTLEAQIDAATKSGDIDAAIHLQNQKLALLNRRV